MTLTKLLEMTLDKTENAQARKEIERTIRHLRKPRRCTADDLHRVNGAVNSFLDWYEEARPPIAEVALSCAKTAVDKIARAFPDNPKKGESKS